MSSAISVLGLSCLTSWFSALLPSTNQDKEEDEFYTVMGLDQKKNASVEDVKKAYKKKSLELHPDKVAQRGGNAQEAAAQYLKVQEANSVLSENKKRNMYHAVGCSPTRYRYLSTGAWHNPTALQNNIGSASCAAKSRILLVVAVILILLLLQPLLIVIKINHILQEDGGALEDTPWTVILIPWWVTQGLYVGLWFLIWLVTVSAAKQNSDSSNAHLVFVNFFEQVCWLAWQVLLAVRWDDTVDWNYVDIFVPFYLVILLRIYSALYTMRKIRFDCKRMVSLPYLEGFVLDEGKSYDDLSEEEKADLHKNYILVHSSNENVHDLLEGLVDEEEIEEARVHSSVEFQHAMDVYFQAFSKLVHSVLFWSPFCVLVVLRLDDHIDASWWLVFLPLWIHLGYNILSNTYVCCCASVAGEEIIIGDDIEEEDGEDTNDEREKKRDLASSVAFAAAEGNMDQFNESEKKRDLASSVAFAAAEGNMDQFNESVNKSDSVPKTEEAETDTAEDKTDSQQLERTKEENTVEEEKVQDVVELYTEKEVLSSPKNANLKIEETEGDQKEERSQADDDMPDIDPDVFEAWQSAYQEAESSAMEEQAKAWGNCCLASFELMLLCLLVGKLDQSYQQNEEDGDDIGYNAIWIIFPILLIAGIALLCCACVIYGGRPSSPEDNDEDANDEGNDGAPVDAEKQQEESGVTTTQEEPAAKATDEEEGGGGGYDADDID